MTDDELRARGWELSMGPHGHAYWVHEQHPYSQDYEMTALEAAACEAYADKRVAEALEEPRIPIIRFAGSAPQPESNGDHGSQCYCDECATQIPPEKRAERLKKLNREELAATGIPSWELQEMGIKPWEVR